MYLGITRHRPSTLSRATSRKTDRLAVFNSPLRKSTVSPASIGTGADPHLRRASEGSPGWDGARAVCNRGSASSKISSGLECFPTLLGWILYKPFGLRADWTLTRTGYCLTRKFFTCSRASTVLAITWLPFSCESRGTSCFLMTGGAI